MDYIHLEFIRPLESQDERARVRKRCHRVALRADQARVGFAPRILAYDPRE